MIFDPTRPAAGMIRHIPAGEGAIEVFRCQPSARRRVPIDVGADEALEISGWGLAKHPWAVFDQLFVVIDDGVPQRAAYGLARADVRAVRRDENLAMCGFEVVFSVAALEPGTHTMSLIGMVDGRAHALDEPKLFHVLARPAKTNAVAPRAELPGRIRAAHGTLRGPRHHGRSDAAIEPGVSLTIAGWYAASPELDIADGVSVVLSGKHQNYRVAARRCVEPEAGVVLGPTRTACGFQTCVDTAGMLPGAYRITTELATSGRWRSAISDVWVEIMGDVRAWFPGLLPMYRAVPACVLDSALPARISQGGSLLIRGRLETPASASGVYVRFDREATYTLTHSAAPPAAHGSTSATAPLFAYEFSGVLAMQLAVGTHELEIIAGDEPCAGGWLAHRHQFEIVADTLLSSYGATGADFRATANK